MPRWAYYVIAAWVLVMAAFLWPNEATRLLKLVPWSALAIYFVVWWIVLFAVLPWGARSQHEDGGEIVAGTDPGAPVLPRLQAKAMWTTVISALVFGLGYAAYAYRLVTLDDLARLFGAPH